MRFGNVCIELFFQYRIVAKISDFKDWSDLLHSTDFQREIGALKLNAYKIGMDPNIIDAAKMLVSHELFAEFVDDEGNMNYTDEEEFEMWKYVMKRLLL